MDKSELKLFNEIIAAKAWLRLAEEISASTEHAFFGKIEVGTSKETLNFDVIVSPDFPAGKIIFKCTNVLGYQHQMHDGSLCLTAPPAKTLADKLELELEKLQLWVERYYINETVDAHYEYLSFYQNAPFPVIFEEDETKPLPKNKFGRFHYGVLNEKISGDKKIHSFIALDLGGRSCRWSESYRKSLNQKYDGLWVYLDKPPVLYRRQTIEEWKELLQLMTPLQTDFIHTESKQLSKSSFFKEAFFLMVGYDIPNSIGKEIHWETVIILFDKFPYEAEKVAPRIYQPKDLGYKVQWCLSSNASYSRTFGRGKLCDKLTEANILIIGVGAIGSTLFTSLVRGGCKQIEIRDGDPIEPGNICRGQFAFNSTNFAKVEELEKMAIATSPFIKVTTRNKVEPILKSNKEYQKLKTDLMDFDYIFDCTTDKYLSIMLDKMQLRGTIINFSITNEAKQFVTVTGQGNIHLIKNSIYERLSPNEQPFYVATGCWSPTFKASFVDINVVLSYAIAEIAKKLGEGKDINSFIISNESTNNIQYKLEYNV
ncbi:hypothetical protein FLAV_00365 [Flavobacteriales bacterium]|nr:hypothetical protein FLAV_00365 [Flavobacteriales bacterium]